MQKSQLEQFKKNKEQISENGFVKYVVASIKKLLEEDKYELLQLRTEQEIEEKEKSLDSDIQKMISILTESKTVFESYEKQVDKLKSENRKRIERIKKVFR